MSEGLLNFRGESGKIDPGKILNTVLMCTAGMGAIGLLVFYLELEVERGLTRAFRHDIHAAMNTPGVVEVQPAGEAPKLIDFEGSQVVKLGEKGGPKRNPAMRGKPVRNLTGSTWGTVSSVGGRLLPPVAGEMRKVVPLFQEAIERLKAGDDGGWVLFKENQPEAYSLLTEEAASLDPNSETKMALVFAHHNYWNLGPEPENIAYVYHHYRQGYENQMRPLIEEILPGFKTVNQLLKDKLDSKDFENGEIALLPETVDDFLSKVVFALPEDFPGGGGEAYDNVVLVWVSPPSFAADSQNMLELKRVLSGNSTHELGHWIQGRSKHELKNWQDSPDFHLSHLCMGVLTAVADGANGFNFFVSGDILLMMQRLEEVGHPDPLGLIVQTAIYPAMAGDLRETYDFARREGDPSAQELVENPRDLPLPPGAMSVFLEQTGPYLPDRGWVYPPDKKWAESIR